VVKQKGMVFGFRKTAIAKIDRNFILEIDGIK
jgi:hypothetical protein